jgi:hypothetical protein
VLYGDSNMVTGSRSSTASATASDSSPGTKQLMSVIAPTGSATQWACTRSPVVTPPGSPPVSTACSSAVSAPSSLISAQANGRSRGWPSSGWGCQVHESTVPTLETGTISVSRSQVTGSYSTTGTWTLPSDPRIPTIWRLRSAVKNAPRVDPTERV